ncbi:MAG: glycosyltransferase [Rickettsiales bacterium]|nr:glycosyltransferase [Rickettsiales bacterium]
MKKILLISYYFPPQTSVGGFRLKRFAQHMSQCGLASTLLTVRNPDKKFHPFIGEMPAEGHYQNIPVHRVKEWPVRWLWQWPARLIKAAAKLLSIKIEEHALASRFWHIDMEWGWIQPAYHKALKLVETEQPNAIVVSCPPFSSAHIGVKLKRRTNLPLILDFRDGWVASSPYLHEVARKDATIERRLLEEANHLIVTSESDLKAYRSVLGEDKVSLIYNGYDAPFALSADEGSLQEKEEDSQLQLLYLGAWGVFGRSPEGLLQALKAANIPWKLISIGSTNEIVTRYAEQLNVANSVQLVDNLPKEDLPPWIAKSDALFVIKGAPQQGGRDTHVAAKIYDYLATGKPILSQLPEGDSKDMLERYCNQHFVAPAEDTQALIKQLKTLYTAKMSGNLQRKPNDSFLTTFSGEQLTQQFTDTILKTLTS